MGLLVVLCALVAACTAKVRPLQEPKQASNAPVEVLVVPLRGALVLEDLALCQRALREAAANGMRVVFRLEDAGGAEESLGDVESLLDAVQATKVGTTAVVRGHARGGAAWLALLCDRLCMLPGSDLGDVAPIETTGEALRAFLEDQAERQRLESLGAAMRERLARKRGGDKLRADVVRVCEGMANRTLRLVSAVVRERGVETTRVLTAEELATLQQQGATIVSQEAMTQPLVLSDREVVDFGLGSAASSLDDVFAEVLRVDRSQVGELTYSWAEHMVGWLQQMQSALLLLGFVLLILEVKTPGIGIPGVLGVLLLSLALFHSYLLGLAEITEVLLFFLGLGAIAVEIFVLPGTVIFGASGFLCLVFALVLSQQTFVLPATVTQQEILVQNLWHLTFLFLLVLVSAAVLWRVLPRIPWLNSVLLPGPAGSISDAPVAIPAPSPLLGRRGRAATVLRPAGILELDGNPVDVVTRGDFYDAGTEVQVVEVEGNRVVVERVQGRSEERGSVGFVLLIAVVGLALLVAEVALVSFGALSVASGIALISAVFLAFQESQAFGIAMLVGEAIAAPLVLTYAFRLLPKTRLGRAILLEAPAPGATPAASDPGIAPLLHKHGVTLSALRPAGFARIEGQRIDVVTRGEMLEEGCPVRVVDVSGNRVVVARDAAH